jgi:hypothetical protein
VVESGDPSVLFDNADGEALSRIASFMAKSSICKEIHSAPKTTSSDLDVEWVDRLVAKQVHFSYLNAAMFEVQSKFRSI